MRKLILKQISATNGCESARELRESLDDDTRATIDPEAFDAEFERMFDHHLILRCTLIDKWTRYFISMPGYDELKRMESCEN